MPVGYCAEASTPHKSITGTAATAGRNGSPHHENASKSILYAICPPRVNRNPLGYVVQGTFLLLLVSLPVLSINCLWDREA